MKVVIHFSDVVGVNDDPVDLASFQHAASFVLLCFEKLDAIPQFMSENFCKSSGQLAVDTLEVATVTKIF